MSLVIRRSAAKSPDKPGDIAYLAVLEWYRSWRPSQKVHAAAETKSGQVQFPIMLVTKTASQVHRASTVSITVVVIGLPVNPSMMPG
jgi:hypothetical protein